MTENEIEWTRGSPEDLQRRLEDPKLIGGPLRRFLLRTVIFLQRVARDNAPVDTGALRGSIGYDLDQSPVPLWGKIGTNKPYATDQEYGTNFLSTRPAVTGNRPWPKGPELETWARRHGFPSGGFVAFLIWRNGGIIPKQFFKAAFDRGKSEINKFLGQLANEIQSAWGN